MQRFSFRTLMFLMMGLGVPALVFAQFKGPPSGVTPPVGNVPGVIWNMAGAPAGQTQNGAEIRINGDANMRSVGTAAGASISNNLFGNIFLENGRGLHIDQNNPTSYWMANWGGPGGASKPFSLKLNGDIYANSIAPSGVGSEGRIQADKFCFNPGNPSDCVTSWANGSYVAKAGDTMTGDLSVNGGSLTVNNPNAVFGGNFTGTNGIQGTGSNFGVIGNGGLVGGIFGSGSYSTFLASAPYGVFASVPQGGFGLGTNGKIHADKDIETDTDIIAPNNRYGSAGADYASGSCYRETNAVAVASNVRLGCSSGAGANGGYFVAGLEYASASPYKIQALWCCPL